MSIISCAPVGTWPQQHTVSKGFGSQHLPHPSDLGPTGVLLDLPVGLLRAGTFFFKIFSAIDFFPFLTFPAKSRSLHSWRI